MPIEGEEIESAVLKVYLKDLQGANEPGNSLTIGAYPLSSNTWNEDTMTWNTAKAANLAYSGNDLLDYLANQRLDSVVIGRDRTDLLNTPISFDVTAHIRNMYNAEKLATVVLAASDGTSSLRYHFYSTDDGRLDGAYDPKLEITVKSPIAAPEGVTGKRGDGKVQLKWDVVEGADYYIVKRGTASGNYDVTFGADKSIDSQSYLDASVTNGTTYYYAVSAYNSEHHSLQSQQIAIVPQAPTAPEAPKGFSVAAGDQVAELDWDAVPEVNNFIDEVQGYRVYRKAPGEADFSLLATIADTQYTDLAVDNQQQYFYKVAAYNESGEGVTEVRYAVPRTAADYSVLKSVSEDGRVQLHWGAIDGATSYNVRRSAISGMAYETVASGLTALTFEDSAVTNGVAYYYVLEAMQSADLLGLTNEVLAIPEKFDVNIALEGDSEASSFENFGVEGWKAFDGFRSATNRWASRTPLQDPTMTDDEANDQWLWVDLGKQRPVGTIVINWDTAYAKSYDIQVSNDKVNWTTVVQERDVTPNPWVSVLRLDEQVLARYVKFQGIERGSPYGYSIYEMEVFTPQMNDDPMEWVAGAPENVAFKHAYASNQQTYLSWDPARGVSSYSIKRKAADEAEFTTIATGMKARVYWDYGLDNDKTYTYILVATNSNGAAESDPISLTPYVQYNVNLDYTPANYNTKSDGYLGISLPAYWRPFSSDSLWNTPIGPNAALDVNSTKVVEEIARYTRAQQVNKFKITFDEWSIPIHVVNADKVPASNIISANAFDFTDWNQDRTPDIKVPIPVNAFREPTEDGHLVVIDPVKKLAWEVSKMKNGDPNDAHDQGKSGETPQNPTSTTLNVWDLTGTGEGIPFDGARWSARGGRGAGMPAFAGLLRPEELLSGEIHHALASGFLNNRRGDDGGVWFAGPAARSDGRAVGEQYPLEGARLQLDPALTEDYFRNTLGMDDYAITVVKALQQYGTYITDITGNFKIYGQLLSNKIDTTYGSASRTPGSSADEWSKLLGNDEYGKFLADIGKIPLDSFRVIDPGTLYKANMPVAVRPTARTMSGAYDSIQQIVLETPTLGANVYYTTDGLTPTEASQRYGAPISVSQNTVIKAIAVKDGMQDSNISEIQYEITGVVERVAAPTADPAAGTYLAAVNVTLETATPGASVYYTMDGSTPTEASQLYSAPIAISQNVTIKAIVVKNGMLDSEVGSFSYTIQSASHEQEPGTPSESNSPEPVSVLEAAAKEIADRARNSAPLQRDEAESMEKSLRAMADSMKGKSGKELRDDMAILAQSVRDVLKLAVGADRDLKTRLQKDAVEVLKNMVNNAGSLPIKPVMENGKAVIVVDSSNQAKLLSTAEDAYAAAQAMKDALGEGFGKMEEAQLHLVVESDGEMMNEMSAEFPAAFLQELNSRQISKIRIVSGVASMVVQTNFVDMNPDQSVTLEAVKLDLNEAQLEQLSPDQRKLVDRGAPLYEFKALIKGKGSASAPVGEFNHKIRISVPYTLKSGENPEKITILYLSADGLVQNMAGKYDGAGHVVFATNHFSKYLVYYNPVSFRDLPNQHWAASAIEALASKGIIDGMGDGTFQAETTVTRAQFAKLVTTALQATSDAAMTDFKDVTLEHWYYKYVAQAVQLGLLRGREDGSFAPDEPISRQDMAVMIAGAFRIMYGASSSHDLTLIDRFADKEEISPYALEAILTNLAYGLMQGKSVSVLDPAGTATRAEAAAFIYNLLND